MDIENKVEMRYLIFRRKEKPRIVDLKFWADDLKPRELHPHNLDQQQS